MWGTVVDFLVISNNKLKIKMNKREMKRYAMNVPEERYNTAEMRTSLWRVLDVAQSECGFCAVGEKLLVQIYSSDDGCEVFVTKLGRLSSSTERNIARSGSVTMLSSKSTLYRFPDITTLLSALRHVRSDSRRLCTDVYISAESICYLLVEERTGAVPISDLSVLCEFGTEASPALIPHLCEHSFHVPARLIFEVIS